MGESGGEAPLNQPSGSLAKLPRLPNKMSGALRSHCAEGPPGRAAPERAAPERAALSAALSAAPAGGITGGGGAAERAAAAASAWPTSAPYPAGSCAHTPVLLTFVQRQAELRRRPL